MYLWDILKNKKKKDILRVQTSSNLLNFVSLLKIKWHTQDYLLWNFFVLCKRKKIDRYRPARKFRPRKIDFST